MEITAEMNLENRERFLSLICSIERPGADLDRLIQQLINSDFFNAPASAMYHLAVEGGLCLHSLNVYDALKMLVDAHYSEDNPDRPSEDSIKICALLHDFDKMNKYEKTVRNQKVYSEHGSKYDEMGKFDWVSVAGYKRKDSCDVFMIGDHGENSVYMTETFVPLSAEEHAAILNHHSLYDNPKKDITGIYNKYSLACLLHLADMFSTYILEKR